MSQTASKASTYIDTITTLISPIEFGTVETLGSAGLIYKQDRSEISHLTEIHVYRDNLKTVILDNVTNQRTHYIVVSIISNAEKRAEQAQEDIYYLEEKLMEVLEKNHDNIGWEYLNNYTALSKGRVYNSAYFYKDIVLEINEEVLTRTS
jgi:hypothetical protein